MITYFNSLSLLKESESELFILFIKQSQCSEGNGGQMTEGDGEHTKWLPKKYSIFSFIWSGVMLTKQRYQTLTLIHHNLRLLTLKINLTYFSVFVETLPRSCVLFDKVVRWRYSENIQKTKTCLEKTASSCTFPANWFICLNLEIDNFLM